MQQLSVTITRKSGVFQLTPQTLDAFTGDQIFWVNDDSQPQQPAAVNPDGSSTPLVGSIAKNDTSGVFTPSVLLDSAGNPISYTITYICLANPGVEGKISITPNL